MRMLVLLLVLAAAPLHAEDEPWSLLRKGGHVVLLRHAQTTNGIGDPPGMRLDDCATQRNLSEEGRSQARRIGEEFRQFRVPVDEVLSSEWCRCVETAGLAFGGTADVWPALNNLFGRPENRQKQIDELAARIALILAPQGQGRFALVGRLSVP